MARLPAIERGTTVRIVLDVSSVGLTDDQFFRLRIESPTILSGDPVLTGFKFDFKEIL